MTLLHTPRQTYRDRRHAAKRRATLQGVALISAMIVFAIGMFPAFQWLDCHNAEKFITAYEACQLDTNCKGMPWHKRTYEKEKWIYYNACPQKD